MEFRQALDPVDKQYVMLLFMFIADFMYCSNFTGPERVVGNGDAEVKKLTSKCEWPVTLSESAFIGSGYFEGFAIPTIAHTKRAKPMLEIVSSHQG